MNPADRVGIATKITTTLTGGGKSVVGNVTISFCTAVVAAVMLAGLFLWAGATPWQALIAFLVAALFFLLFLLMTLKHAAAHPDAAVTSEEYYARVIETRMGAKDPQIIKAETPVLGGARDAVAAIPAPEGDTDDA